MPRIDPKRSNACERCGPRPVQPDPRVAKILRAIARATEDEVKARLAESLRTSQSRWDFLHERDGRPKKTHGILPHPDVLKASLEEMHKDTRALLDQAAREPWHAFQTGSSERRASMYATGTPDRIWRHFGTAGLQEAIDRHPERVELAQFSPPIYPERTEAREIEELVEVDLPVEEPPHVEEGVPAPEPEPVETFVPSFRTRKRKRPRPNRNQPRVIQPSFADLAEEWR